jgi:biopolymer transport protein ExbD
MSEINVTPMVDVMLVLLVVFMVSAPLMTVGVPVDLPKTDASQMVGQDEPLVVSVNAKGEVFLQETKIALEQLVPRLVAITQNKKDTRIFVRGDKAIAYGQGDGGYGDRKSGGLYPRGAPDPVTDGNRRRRGKVNHAVWRDILRTAASS